MGLISAVGVVSTALHGETAPLIDSLVAQTSIGGLVLVLVGYIVWGVVRTNNKEHGDLLGALESINNTLLAKITEDGNRRDQAFREYMERSSEKCNDRCMAAHKRIDTREAETEALRVQIAELSKLMTNLAHQRDLDAQHVKALEDLVKQLQSSSSAFSEAISTIHQLSQAIMPEQGSDTRRMKR